jgi:hypothetical protein
MGTNEKLLARRRAREAQRKINEERIRRDRANAADAETIRAILHRVDVIDMWERTRLAQAAELVRADGIRKRAGHFRGLQLVVDQMRARGTTFATIAELANVDVGEVRTALRRARNGDVGGGGSTTLPAPSRGLIHGSAVDKVPVNTELIAEYAGPCLDGDRGADAYDPTKCVRCDAVMLDEDANPRRGRRRLYCSDTCRRDASAARLAAERYGAPIRLAEVPKPVVIHQEPAQQAVAEAHVSIAPRVAVDVALGNADALCILLAHLTEQARLKQLDRRTLTAARVLSKAVHPQGDW